MKTWTVREISLPTGVERCDASELLGKDVILDYHHHKQGPSALTALKGPLLERGSGSGWWFDTLVFCRRPAGEFSQDVVDALVPLPHSSLEILFHPDRRDEAKTMIGECHAFCLSHNWLVKLGIPQNVLPPAGSYLHECLGRTFPGHQTALELSTLHTLLVGARSLEYLNWMISQCQLFSPNSGGDPIPRINLTISCVASIFPILERALPRLSHQPLLPLDMEALCQNESERQAAERLGQLFLRHGSDKSALHNYYHLYGHILQRPESISGILEIGLGSNNPDVVSNMGPAGKPGASLRAFRDFLPHAQVYGADIDRRILFTEERIQTWFVDQLDPASFEVLGNSLPETLDLIIDDGLHSPAANMNTLEFAISRIRPGGWVVIEDIGPAALPFWQVVAALIPDRFKKYLLRGRAVNGWVFALNRRE